MVEAIRVLIRYDYKDERGSTRRERNAEAAEDGAVDKSGAPVQEAPPLYIPPEGQHIWDWYQSLSRRLLRVRDGVCYPIPPSEYRAWCEAGGHIIRPSEYETLCAMDDAYCEEMGKELADYREREKDRSKFGK